MKMKMHTCSVIQKSVFTNRKPVSLLLSASPNCGFADLPTYISTELIEPLLTKYWAVPLIGVKQCSKLVHSLVDHSKPAGTVIN